MKIVQVAWIDAQHPCGEWLHLDALKGPLPVIQSVGFLVHEDKHKLVLAVSTDGQHVSGEMTIPKVCVKKRKVMR